MDDREKSDRRNRDRHSERDHDHKHHRSRHDSDEHRHHRSDRNSKRDHKTRDREDREGSRDRERDRDRSYDRDEREGSKGRSKLKREDEREDSVEPRHSSHSHKRKEREHSEERELEDKRVRVSDEKKEVKRERRKFGDKVKKEEEQENGDNIGGFQVHVNEVKVKEEATDGARGSASAPMRNGNALGSPAGALPSLPETSLAPSPPVPIKVSSISTTNENKGVSITRSHEVTGKSSTDGSSSTAGKPGSLSIDALAKAKKALQMQKELSEKLKKIPQGCDASVLLDDTSTFTGEKNSFPNANSLRGFEVIDNIKSELESLCPGVVSCADILTLAARDAILAIGGPRWNVKLGRRDSTTASLDESNSDLPAPFLDRDGLVTAFAKKNFSQEEMVTLSGAHTIGFSRCIFFRRRIYNETNIDSAFAASMQEACPFEGGDDNLSPFDSTTPLAFDNVFYENLMKKKGLVHSDQELFVNGSGPTDSQVKTYSRNSGRFKRDFSDAMVKMTMLSPLTGSDGEIRTNCRVVNALPATPTP